MTVSSWALRALLAFASGVLWAFAFAREPLVLAPWFALVPLLLLLGGRRPALMAWCHGLGFWMTGMSWIPATLATFGSLPGWLAGLGLLLLAAYLGLFHALFGALAAPAWRRGGWPVLVVLPAAWVLCEFLRGRGPAGFSWNLAGYSVVGVPGALDAAVWFGALGISALVVLVNVAVARSIVKRTWAPAVWTCLAVLGLLPVFGRLGELPIEERASRPVAVLQPNIPNMAVWDPQIADANYRKVLELSAAACRPGELLIWPESAAWPYSFEPGKRLSKDVSRLLESGCSLLLNSPVREGGKYFNAALLESPAPAVGSRYDKQRLVPFGEYVPLGRWLPFLERIARAAGDFSPGGREGNLDWNDVSLGTSICFEITFPEDVAGKVARGADVLVTMTNDAWYGDTWAPWQHLRAARFRAAENRRPLLRAAITGVSAVIDRRGGLSQSLGVDEEGLLRARISPGGRRTLYTRWPHALPLVAFVIVAFAIFRNRKRPSGAGSDG